MFYVIPAPTTEKFINTAILLLYETLRAKYKEPFQIEKSSIIKKIILKHIKEKIFGLLRQTLHVLCSARYIPKKIMKNS